MKKLILLCFTPILIYADCSGDGNQKLDDQRVDDLWNQPTKLPEIQKDTMTTIDMGGGIEESLTKTVVKVETVDNRQRIVLYLPEVQDGPHIGRLTLDVTLVADTVQAFSLTARSVKTPFTVKKDVDPPAKKHSCGKIKDHDTRFSIAKRLGVPVTAILNKEPLTIGEEIRVKQ